VSEEAPTGAAGQRFEILFWWTAALLSIFNLSLRAWAARGPLWLDELWSVDLVRSFGWRSVAVVFDNNHPLNTAWINLMGPDAHPWLLRLPGILAGPASVLAVGLLLRNSQAAPFLGMGLVSLCSTLVVIGSEARGYGMMLSTLFVMLWAARRGSTEPGSYWRVVMALAVLVGVLAQPLGAAAAAAAGISFLWLRWLETGQPRAVLLDGMRFLGPGILACVVLGALVLLQSLAAGARMGDYVPFAPDDLLRGWLSLQALILGLPAGMLSLTGLACLTVLVLAILKLDRESLAISLPLFLVPPILMAVLKLPNTIHSRYHLVSGCGLLLMFALLCARYWSHGGGRRAAAAVVLLGWSAGQVELMADFRRSGRGDFLPAIQAASLQVDPSGAPVTVGVDSEARGLFLLSDAARRAGLAFSFVPRKAYCLQPPALYLQTGRGTTNPALIVVAEQGCAANYSLLARVDSSRINGMPGAIYRLDNTAMNPPLGH
jgi:hypothetical protein